MARGFSLVLDISAKCSQLMDLAQNAEKYLHHGWFVVRNRTPSEVHNKLGNLGRQKRETDFFDTAPWNKLPSERRGTQALKAYLADLLGDRIRESFPSMLATITKRIESTNSRLTALGSPRKTVEEKRAYLVGLGQNFHYLASQALRGRYSPSTNNSVKLRRLIREANDEFACEMKTNGHAVPFVELPQLKQDVKIPKSGFGNFGKFGTPGDQKTSGSNIFGKPATSAVCLHIPAIEDMPYGNSAYIEKDQGLPFFGEPSYRRFQSISATRDYQKFSHEELRLNHYLQNFTASPPSQASSSLFSTPVTASTDQASSGFSAPLTASTGQASSVFSAPPTASTGQASSVVSAQPTTSTIQALGVPTAASTGQTFGVPPTASTGQAFGAPTTASTGQTFSMSSAPPTVSSFGRASNPFSAPPTASTGQTSSVFSVLPRATAGQASNAVSLPPVASTGQAGVGIPVAGSLFSTKPVAASGGGLSGKIRSPVDEAKSSTQPTTSHLSWNFRDRDPAEIYQWIKLEVKASRGTELQGILNPDVLPVLFHKQIRKWRSISKTHFRNTVEISVRILLTLLETTCPDPLVRDKLEASIRQASDHAEAIGLQQLGKRLDDLTTRHLQTNNSAFEAKVHEARQLRFQAALQRYRAARPVSGLERPFGMSNYEFETRLIIDTRNTASLFEELHMSNSRNLENEIHDILKAYYEIARDDFVEYVNQFIVEPYLNDPKGPVLFFSPLYVGELSKSEIESLATESASLTRERAELEATLTRLRRAEAIARKYR